MPRKGKKPPPAEPTWRSISQKGKLRSTSDAARGRRLGRLAKVAGIAAVILVLGGGVGYALYFSGQHLDRLNPSPETTFISELDFASDGVLDDRWFLDRYPLPGDVAAMSVDVHGLKARLEREGQIAWAAVSISLPDTLVVRVQERRPLLRARVRVPEGAVRTVLIAADGVVFEGDNYSREMLRELPGLVGAPFEWEAGRFRDLGAMATVAPLLERARRDFPALYQSWQWISLDELPADPEAPNALILVKSREADRIVFAPRVYARQLQKLQEVIALAGEQSLPGFQSIDLSFSDQAIVQPRKS